MHVTVEQERPDIGFLGSIGLLVLTTLVAMIFVVPAVIYLAATKADKSLLLPVAAFATAAGSLVVASQTWRGWNLSAAAVFGPMPALRRTLPWTAAGVAALLLMLTPSIVLLARLWPWFRTALEKETWPAPGPVWLAAPLIVLLAPIAEELLFRGVMLRGMLRRYPERTAILASAVIFALAHGSLVRFPIILSIGVGLGWLYARSGSLWLPIAAHMLNNAIAAAGYYWFPKAGEASMAPWLAVTLIVAGLAVLTVSTPKLRRGMIGIRAVGETPHPIASNDPQPESPTC
jgi:hypothetical protein